MLSLQAAVLLAACSAGDATLLDFSAEWCTPCKQMEPVLDHLAAQGYPVRKINIDHDRALASQYRVSSIPCLVLVVDGREVERTVGATNMQSLAAMFQRHGVGPKSQATQLAAAAPAPVKPAALPRPIDAAPDIAAQLLAASVRLKISDPNGNSYGSGTIVDVRGDEALVVTCGHIFRDSQGQGKVVIDMFGAGAPHGLSGRVIGYDLKSDVGLVSFRPGCPVRTARLASTSYQVRRNDPVVSIGCNNGSEPSVRSSRVTSLDKFLGPPNIQVAGQPVQGRSGGGLFSADGRVIGICNAADPTDDEGLFAALPSIWALLQQHHWLPEIAPERGTALVGGGLNAEAALSQGRVPSMPQNMPPTATMATTSTAPTAAATATTSTLDASQQAALATIASRAPGAEVICIVRSPDDPQSRSDVIVLDKVSPEFIQYLSAERSAQQQRMASIAQRTTPTATPVASSGGNVVRNAPLVNVRGGTPAPTATWRPNWVRPR